MARKGAALEMAVLGLLHESPLHGYELRKRLNLLLGWTRLLSYGSLYPALKRMLREGVITEVTNPASVSLRQRITYQITDAGREVFATEVTDDGPSAWEDESFNMRFAFFSRTSADVRLADPRGPALATAGAPRPAAARRRRRRPLPQRAAAARHRVRGARGPLAHRPDQRRTGPGQRPEQDERHQTHHPKCTGCDAGGGNAVGTQQRKEHPAWDRFE